MKNIEKLFPVVENDENQNMQAWPARWDRARQPKGTQNNEKTKNDETYGFYFFGSH